MKEREVNFKLLQVLAGYAMLNLIFALAALQFKPSIEIIVLTNVMLLVGWLYFCILQCRVQYYVRLKTQQKILQSVARKEHNASAKLCSTNNDISRFEKSFLLTMKIIRLLEGKNDRDRNSL